MMMRINKKKREAAVMKEKALTLRIDQLNEQVETLVGMVEDRDAEIKLLQGRCESLAGQLEEKTLLFESTRSGNLMATGIIDNYIKLIRNNLPQELIEKCQEVSYANDLSDSETFEAVALDDIISAVYAVFEKYFPKS